VAAATLFLVLLISTARAADDPGKVTWATGYPQAVDSAPPVVTGKLVVYGDYTVNQNYTITSVAVYYALKRP
jgi:hypothetical protein